MGLLSSVWAKPRYRSRGICISDRGHTRLPYGLGDVRPQSVQSRRHNLRLQEVNSPARLCLKPLPPPPHFHPGTSRSARPCRETPPIAQLRADPRRVDRCAHPRLSRHLPLQHPDLAGDINTPWHNTPLAKGLLVVRIRRHTHRDDSNPEVLAEPSPLTFGCPTKRNSQVTEPLLLLVDMCYTYAHVF